MQLTLLDAFPPAADPAFASARRVELGQGAWLELVPGWLRGHAAFFDELRRVADWEQHRRQMFEREVDVPRLVASSPDAPGAFPMGDAQVVGRLPRSASPYEVEAACVLLRAMSRLLSARYGRPLDRITLAYYRDGRDSVAFHGDKLGDLRPDTVVAILSVGARRRFVMRPVAGGDTRTLSVGEGDLLVMGGSCQATWQHAVPKMRVAGPRIAVMFRQGHAEVEPGQPD